MSKLIEKPARELAAGDILIWGKEYARVVGDPFIDEHRVDLHVRRYPQEGLTHISYGLAELVKVEANPCPHPCSVCGYGDHHWLVECDDDHPEGIMVCKHCPATRPITDEDMEA